MKKGLYDLEAIAGSNQMTKDEVLAEVRKLLEADPDPMVNGFIMVTATGSGRVGFDYNLNPESLPAISAGLIMSNHLVGKITADCALGSEEPEYDDTEED